MRKVLFLAAVCLVASSMPALSAHADGCVLPRDIVWADEDSLPRAESGDQRAIILWNGTEISLTLSTGYTGDGGDAAWIIPTAIPPEAGDVRETGESGEEAFQALEEITAVRQPRSGVGGVRGSDVGTSQFSWSDEDDVKVFGKLSLEHYEVSVLGAKRSTTLLGWLQENGYRIGTGATAILDEYVRDRWAFVAVKLKPSEKRHYQNEFLPPLTIAYRSDRIVFPLRVSSVSTPREVKITLYVIAGSTVSSSNFSTTPLQFEGNWLLHRQGWDEYVESSIRRSAVSGDRHGIVVTWSGDFRGRPGLDSMSAMRFAKGRYLTRLESRMAPSDMVDDLRLQLDRSPKEFAPQPGDF
jgi:hypothetical protein